MEEMGGALILDSEGFYFIFAQTGGFLEGNSKIFQLIKGNTHLFQMKLQIT